MRAQMEVQNMQLQLLMKQRRTYQAGLGQRSLQVLASEVDDQDGPLSRSGSLVSEGSVDTGNPQLF